MWKLEKAFVKKDCVDISPSDYRGDGEFQITCFVEVPGWNKAWVHYYYDSIDYGGEDAKIEGFQKFKLSYLQVIDEGRSASSLEEIYFFGWCMDSIKYTFQIIEYRRENPDESPYCLVTHTDVVKRLNQVFGKKIVKRILERIVMQSIVP